MDQKQVNDFADMEVCRDALLYYLDSPLFQDEDSRYETNLYKRKLRPHIIRYLDYSKPLTLNTISDYSTFSANRSLASMYEQDFLILPDKKNAAFEYDAFCEFYSPERKAAAGCAIPALEKYLFNFLNKEIQISGDWNLKTVESYFLNYAEESNNSKEKLKSVEAIENSSDQSTTAKDLLIQLAPDFLLESSPMARYTGGCYGEIGSSLFKVIIDELGYGVYEKKHSVLYTDTMKSVGLNPLIHRYWQYYLNSSLMLANYYNMITRDKRYIFRYIGAIYQAETSFISTCAAWKKALKMTLPGIDTRYFTEHVHVDQHHSRMVFNELVKPTIEMYGNKATEEIIRGFEEAKWLANFAENDFAKQIKWKDSAAEYQGIHDAIFSSVEEAAKNLKIKKQTFVEPKDELSVTHSHDEDELCHINSGELEFLNGFGKSTILKPGKGIVIKHQRLHGALITSKSCDYSIYTIGDHAKWTN